MDERQNLVAALDTRVLHVRQRCLIRDRNTAAYAGIQTGQGPAESRRFTVAITSARRGDNLDQSNLHVHQDPGLTATLLGARCILAQ